MESLAANRPLADERARAYKDALLEGLPPCNAAAVNEVVPFLLWRIRNERASVREEVSCRGWLGATE